MNEKTYEDLKNNENSKTEKELQNLIKQIDELKDADKSNDKIEWVFSETKEWWELIKSLNQWLTKYLETQPEEKRIISEEIKKLINNPNIKIDEETKNSLKLLWNLIDWVKTTDDGINFNDDTPRENSIIPEDNEVLENQEIDIDFLKSITFDEIKELFENPNPKKYSEIKKELIIEKNWKKYINFKWKLLTTELDLNKKRNEQENYIYYENKAFNIKNKNLNLQIDNEKINIENWLDHEIFLNNWGHIKIITNPDRSRTRTTNEMDFKVKREKGKNVIYKGENPELRITLHHNYEKILGITKILSLKKNSKEKCSVENYNMIRLWDVTIDLYDESNEETKEIAKWINKYKY